MSVVQTAGNLSRKLTFTPSPCSMRGGAISENRAGNKYREYGSITGRKRYLPSLVPSTFFFEQKVGERDLARSTVISCYEGLR